MKRLWLAWLFFFGGFAHELRHPVECHTLPSRARARVIQPPPRAPTP
jgi:hypothetical protein